jgi:CO/xanthine dehydrogenase FAD-binding subunit
VDFLRPATWPEALAARAAHPHAIPVTGGTDVMVELRSGRLTPLAILDLSRVEELADWVTTARGWIRIGAAVTYRRIITELGHRLPGLAMAARTVGSPQIRNRGTIGGNLGAVSRARDTCPPLLAAGAVVELASAQGIRMVPVADFVAGPHRGRLAPDELIAAIHIPPADGPQQFAKVGRRNAMTIAVCALGLALRPHSGSVGVAINSAAALPSRAVAAERFLGAELTATGMWESPRMPADSVLRRFGELVGAAADPVDDVRGTAGYRRHALTVLARRALGWACRDYCEKRW